jgi:hypothetical protein
MLWLLWWAFIPLRHPVKYQGPPKDDNYYNNKKDK